MRKLLLVVCLGSALFSCREKTRCERLWDHYDTSIRQMSLSYDIDKSTIPEINDALEKCGCYKSK